MAQESIIKSIRKYLNELQRLGVPIKFGILFGSHARKDTNRWSDIDLLVVSPRYDETYNREDINMLWRTAARTDNRIRTRPCRSSQVGNGRRKYNHRSSTTRGNTGKRIRYGKKPHVIENEHPNLPYSG